MIQMEYASGFMKYVTMDKVYLQEQCTYNGYTYTVYKGSGDGGAAEKIVALKAAVKTVIDAGFTLPAGLRWYCINDMNVQNRVFARDPGWNAIYYVTLGPTTCTPGSVASISNGPHPGFTKGHVTCIHELGHVLHAARLGEDFYATNDQGGCTGAPTGVNAVKVSGYAGGAKKEFVAEVFAGMMIGRTYDDQVMAEYRLYKGPER
jgi:hypothetical protein